MVHLPGIHHRVQILEILPGRYHIIEPMLQLVAEHVLVAFELLVAFIALEEAAGNTPAITGGDGAVRRQTAVIAALGVVLEHRQQREAGILGDIDGQ